MQKIMHVILFFDRTENEICKNKILNLSFRINKKIYLR